MSSSGTVTAGGALMQTTDVENIPGFPDAIMAVTATGTGCQGRD